MKSALRNYSMMVFTLIVAVMFSFANTAVANHGKKESKKEIPGLEFKYIGSKNNQPVFLLNVAGNGEEEYIVSFRDRTGNVLYSDRFKGSNITQRFIINTEEVGVQELSVQIRAVKGNQVELYRIGTTQNVVTDVTVNKLK